MSRTDNNGRSIESLLHYLQDGEFFAQDVANALGVSHATYYRRKRDEDYPNAEELRMLARRFGLNAADLMVRFGLLTADEVSEAGGGKPLKGATRQKTKRRSRIPQVRVGGPPL
jgi:transcriptional regulator with XRE-family HTH domain